MFRYIRLPLSATRCIIPHVFYSNPTKGVVQIVTKTEGRIQDDSTVPEKQDTKVAEDIFKKRLIDQDRKFNKERPEWEKRDIAIKNRHGTWNPTKKLSRQQMQDIRNLSEQMPHLKTIDLANHYLISPEAIRRILASKWIPKEEEEENILARAEKRKGERREIKRGMAEDIDLARKRLTYARRIRLNDISLDKKENNYKSMDLRSRFTENGKIKFDSSNNHGYYNKKGTQKKTRRNPFAASVGDMID